MCPFLEIMYSVKTKNHVDSGFRPAFLINRSILYIISNEKTELLPVSQKNKHANFKA
jgi:hypothetical protein